MLSLHHRRKAKKKDSDNVRQFLAVARGVCDGLVATKSGFAGREMAVNFRLCES
jgi:hypothetical protein